MMLRVVLKWFAHWVSYSAYAGLKCWVHGKWVGSRLAQRCVGGQSSHNMARIAGYCAGIGALEWAREGRLRVPGALRGALCALLATWCVLVKDDMAWVICAACCRGAHSRFEREASVGCRGLRCVWCVCGARASSRRRGLKRWERVCAQRVAHVCVARAGFFGRSVLNTLTHVHVHVLSSTYYYYSRQNGTALTTQVPSPPTVQAHSTSQRHGRAHTRDLSRPLTSIATLARTSPHTYGNHSHILFGL